MIRQAATQNGIGLYVPVHCSPDQIGGSGAAFQRSGYGLGCAGECGCGGKCGGLGFFDSGTDFSGWGVLEWGAAALAGYVIMSTIFTTQRAARRTYEGAKKYKRKAKRMLKGRRKRVEAPVI